jgi:hypothetical protein
MKQKVGTVFAANGQPKLLHSRQQRVLDTVQSNSRSISVSEVAYHANGLVARPTSTHPLLPAEILETTAANLEQTPAENVQTIC